MLEDRELWQTGTPVIRRDGTSLDPVIVFVPNPTDNLLAPD